MPRWLKIIRTEPEILHLRDHQWASASMATPTVPVFFFGTKMGW